ncbi:cell wall-binding repeat-containing protein [Herbiconiux sp.]|uniref:cell wall-binding repeat-containing protein n=1 Tax=Herbiconiux sp. TaxID=1871186 RepID=UPI0025BA5343|nr:cell wall-binding repeat-containing protein [Herbiconiux sp.]
MTFAVRSTRSIVLAALLAAAVSVGGFAGAAVAAPAAPAAEAADAAGPTVDRIAGADRYEAAVNISKASKPGGSPVVFLVTGQNYPDALSAAPAAVHLGAPLLLTTKDSLPAVVLAEIERLAPQLVVIVGGVNSVSKAVETQIGAIINPDQTHPAINRVAGADRYEASRNIITYAFGTAASKFYIATGANFPDALSAGSAGGAADTPVLLVDGGKPTLDGATQSFLTTRDANVSVKIAGGPNSVSPGIEAYLRSITDDVKRFAGADRFEASLAINHDAFTGTAPARVFLATGSNFPDALAGAAYAGALKSPLFVVHGDCVPSGILVEIAELGAKKVTLLGGPASLSAGVAALQSCEGPQ